MLIYTSVQDKRGSLSVLDAKRYIPAFAVKMAVLTIPSYSGTSSFQGDVSGITINSNGLSFNLEAIESVQLLHYVSMLFPGPDGDDIQYMSGLLPSQNAEIVIQTGLLDDDIENGNVSQLVVQCKILICYHIHVFH